MQARFKKVNEEEGSAQAWRPSQLPRVLACKCLRAAGFSLLLTMDGHVASQVRVGPGKSRQISNPLCMGAPAPTHTGQATLKGTVNAVPETHWVPGQEAHSC